MIDHTTYMREYRNVTVISKRANTLKGNCTDPRELCDVAAYVADGLSLRELCALAENFNG